MNIKKKEIFEFLKRLNFGVKNKKKYIVSDKFDHCDQLLIYLFEMRLIKNYKIMDNFTFKIELAYDINGNSVIRGLRRVSKRRYKEQISLQNLQKIIFKKIPIYLFVETRQGVLPITSCIKYRTGGNLLFEFIKPIMLYNKLIYGKSFIYIELRTFSNVYILWLSSLLGYQRKKIIRKNFPVNFMKDLQINNTFKSKVLTFYKLLTNKKKNKNKTDYNAQLSNLQNTIIGLSRGFKRKIRLKGIGYKFLSDKNILTFRIGFTHSFTVPLSSLLYWRINKKRTKLLLKYNDYNKLTLFLSAFQNVKKPNIYTGKGIRYNLKKFYQKEGKKKKF